VRLTPLYRMQFTGIQGVGRHRRRSAHCLLTRGGSEAGFRRSVERSASSIRAGMGLRTRHVGHDVLTRKLKEAERDAICGLRHSRLDRCRGAAQRACRRVQVRSGALQAYVAYLMPQDRCSPGDIRLTRALDANVGLMARRGHRYGVISNGMPAKLAFGLGVSLQPAP
jgi:hypothetical protein